MNAKKYMYANIHVQYAQNYNKNELLKWKLLFVSSAMKNCRENTGKKFKKEEK